MFLVKVTRNRGRVSTWGCPLGALRVAVVCISSGGCWKYLPLACLGEGDGELP
jgi:hypothetical protein